MTLPAPVVDALGQARPFAEHADALAELEDDDWRFALSDAGIYVAEREVQRGGTRRLYDDDLARLIGRARYGTPTGRSRRPSGGALPGDEGVT